MILGNDSMAAVTFSLISQKHIENEKNNDYTCMILRNTEFALFIFWLYWIIKHFICDKQTPKFCYFEIFKTRESRAKFIY